jgi:GxxExxY protein
MNHRDTKTPRELIPAETDEVASKIVDAAFTVHKALGPGLLESIYEVCLLHELNKRGLKAECRGEAAPRPYAACTITSASTPDFGWILS